MHAEQDPGEGPLPDLRNVSDGELKTLIDEIAGLEYGAAARQQLLQGKLEALHAERIARFKRRPPDVDAELVAEAMVRRWFRRVQAP